MAKSRSRRKKNHKKRIKLSPQLNKKLMDKQKELEKEALEAEELAVSEEKYAWHFKVRVIVFFVVLFFGFILSFIIPLRPTYSSVEQRDLSSFPKWSTTALFSGEYFDDINTWFADTFPGREGWVKCNSLWQTLYGFGNSRMYGKVDEADDIPDIPSAPEPTVTVAPATTTTKALVTTTTTKGSTTTTIKTTTTKPVATTTTINHDKWNEKDDPNLKNETLNGILVRGKTAYEYYSFSKESSDKYAATIKRAATKLKGKAKVYDIIVPTSIGIMLDEKVRNELNSSDQLKASNYMYSLMGPDVGTVPIVETLRSHNDEYIYFHSDHHWTARGAYYAYASLRQVQGKSANTLDSYRTKVFEGFKGSFFSETNDAKLMEDSVTAYYPHAETSMYLIQEDGTRLDWQVIQDVTDWAARSKYNTFIGGDNPFTEITNKNLKDNSACVVIKESFGNALVPFLVDHYQKVYVVDYRYYDSMKLSSFVEKYKIQDVIFANNVSATRSESKVDAIADFVG